MALGVSAFVTSLAGCSIMHDGADAYASEKVIVATTEDVAQLVPVDTVILPARSVPLIDIVGLVPAPVPPDMDGVLVKLDMCLTLNSLSEDEDVPNTGSPVVSVTYTYFALSNKILFLATCWT